MNSFIKEEFRKLAPLGALESNIEIFNKLEDKNIIPLYLAYPFTNKQITKEEFQYLIENNAQNTMQHIILSLGLKNKHEVQDLIDTLEIIKTNYVKFKQ